VARDLRPGWAAGFDGAKKVNGIKRHVLVDSAGIFVTAVVTEANVHDLGRLPEAAAQGQTCRPNQHACLGGQGLHGLSSRRRRTQGRSQRRDRVRTQNPATGSSSSHAVGSSNAANAGSTTAAGSTATTKPPSHAHEGFLILSQIALLLRRLDRSQSFDTL